MFDVQIISKVDDKRKLDGTIISNLCSMLHESNPIFMLYKTAHELLTANHDEVNNSVTPFVRIFFLSPLIFSTSKKGI
jgi:hypothetical protein